MCRVLGELMAVAWHGIRFGVPEAPLRPKVNGIDTASQFAAVTGKSLCNRFESNIIHRNLPKMIACPGK
jgi:hypothetical protein